MFGWTFEEYDRQPANEILQYIKLKGIYDDVKAQQRGNNA